ncbi:hypothetical protein [Actinoallomurus sp. CA-150999]|uniref:hypothetical protein n=1 Tax=Actinoallomurus sp. CA-150999 TaxID=3239887 RepID=UPI003D91D952
MSSFLSAIPALIGVVIGVIATGWVERTHWRRSQAIRWDERRIDAYVEYAKAIKKIHMTVLAMVEPSLVHNLAEPINREAGLEMIAQAEAHRAEAWETMLLLADQPTAYAALRWHDVVKIEAEFVRSRPNDAGSDDWIAAVRNANEARDHFYEAARKSVNVTGGQMTSTITQLLATEQARQDREQIGQHSVLGRADP